jgi:hypothetical protein
MDYNLTPVHDDTETPVMSMTSGHRDWVLLNVGSPEKAIKGADTGDWNRCDPRALSMLNRFDASTWLVACIEHFAVYDAVEERSGSYRWVRLRYWVGLTLHPSVLSANPAWEGTPEIDGIPEELREYKSALLQTFMSACTGVAARVVWAKTYGGGRYRGNRRYYPAGGGEDYDSVSYPPRERRWLHHRHHVGRLLRGRHQRGRWLGDDRVPEDRR